MDPFDQGALMVALKTIKLCAEALSLLLQLRIDLSKGVLPVETGVASAQKVEVGAVEHQNPHRFSAIDLIVGVAD